MGKKGEETRRLIRQNAARLFAAQGYAGVSMQDVCDACGLSKGGLYRHYEDKAQLFADLLKELQGQETGREEEGMAQGRPATEILRAYLAGEAGQAQRGAGLELALYEFCLEQKDGVGPAILLEQYRRGEAALLELIRYGGARGEFRVNDPRGAAAAILFLLEGLRMAGQVMPVAPETWRGVCGQVERLLGVTQDV